MLTRVASALCLLFCATNAVAHHSFDSEFDKGKVLKLVGYVKKVDWVNPHIFLYMDIQEANGTSVSWSLESLPPAFWRQLRITKAQVFNEGQKVTVLANPGKRDPAAHLAFMQRLVRPDGTYFQTDAFIAEPTEVHGQ